MLKKIQQKRTKKIKLSAILGGFGGLNDLSYQISEDTFTEAIFPQLSFLFWSLDPCRSRNITNYTVIFQMCFSQRKQVGMIRRRLFLHLSEAQSTGMQRRRPPPETAARWRCVIFINNLTAHYKSQFCSSFHFCFDQMTISGSKLGLNMFFSKFLCFHFFRQLVWLSLYICWIII